MSARPTCTVVHGDSREALAAYPDDHFDSVACDPPYALVTVSKRLASPTAKPIVQGRDGVYARQAPGFMGKSWDNGSTAFDPPFWAEVLRVLKPGGHVVAFGGTRTFHRLACAIEDAGFEIRDQIAWLYGSGFPKSHDVAKGIDRTLGTPGEVVATGAPVKRMIPGADQHRSGWEKTGEREFQPGEYRPGEYRPGSPQAQAWEGWGTALKPALEPIVLARKPLAGSVAANVLAHGTGALNIGGCRIATGEGDDPRLGGGGSWTTTRGQSENTVSLPAATLTSSPLGRWPANVVHDGSGEVLAGFPAEAGGGSATPRGPRREGSGWDRPCNEEHAALKPAFGDSGSAARFFYTAKADADDRVKACTVCAAEWRGGRRPCACPHPDAEESAAGKLAPARGHPTVKPVDLMRWLVRLITPKGSLVLDPFAGTGTTGEAALLEGCSAVLIEREAEYVAYIRHRLAHMRGEDAPLFAEAAE